MADQDNKMTDSAQSGKWGWISALCGIPAFLIFIQHGDIVRAMVAFESVGMIVFLVWLKRSLINLLWFWCALLFFVAYHVLAIAHSPLGYRHFPGLAAAPFIAADFFAMYFVLKGVEHFVRGSKIGSFKIFRPAAKPTYR